jgi:DNA replicative helicase MCM subunit Mcm2 (Cdc46/Mcm family)
MELVQELGDDAPPLEEAVQVRRDLGRDLGAAIWAPPDLISSPGARSPACAARLPDDAARATPLVTRRGLLLRPAARRPARPPAQVRPFNLRAEHTRAIRDLDPLNLDTLVAVRGMVTRTGTIIPDLR